MTGVLARQLWQQESASISGVSWNCSVIRSLLLHGSNPSEQDGVAQVPSLSYPFRNDREVVLVRSPEHVHRLVGSYRGPSIWYVCKNFPNTLHCRTLSLSTSSQSILVVNNSNKATLYG